MIVDRPFLVVTGFFGCLLLLALVSRSPDKPVNADERGLFETDELAVESLPVVQEEAAQRRIKDLERLEQDHYRRQEALARTTKAREWRQTTHARPWSEVLATNAAAYQKLRAEAARSPTGETPCTLCDGAHYMHYCVLCKKNDGLCVDCGGSGKVKEHDLCPACVGTGKCYLCFGNGRMSCPFCNDGMISIKWRRPPGLLPID